MENLYKNIKARREELGMTQEELTAKLNYKHRSSINKIEQGINDLPQSKISEFAVALNTTVAKLMGWDTDDKPSHVKKAARISPAAHRVGRLYDKADQHTRDIVDLTLKPFDDGSIALSHTDFDIIDFPVAKRPMTLHDLPASAGTGVFLDSDNFETVEVGPDVPICAHFGVRISGDSMQPAYPDGHIAWVRRTPCIDEGQVGVFVLNSEGYIKKFGHGALISLNPKYPPIVLTEDDDLRTCGQVVGVTENTF